MAPLSRALASFDAIVSSFLLRSLSLVVLLLFPLGMQQHERRVSRRIENCRDEERDCTEKRAQQ